jgi:hypothetical protein
MLAALSISVRLVDTLTPVLLAIQKLKFPIPT